MATKVSIDNNKNTKRIIQSETLFDILLDCQDVLDNLDLYTYKHWIKGEPVSGPYVTRYWVNFTLRYEFKMLPDPAGAERLMHHGINVKFEIITEDVVQTNDDGKIIVANGKPKTKEEKFWLIHIEIPRRYISDANYHEVDWTEDDEPIEAQSTEDAEIEDVNDDSGVEDEGDVIQDDEQGNEQQQQ